MPSRLLVRVGGYATLADCLADLDRRGLRPLALERGPDGLARGVAEPREP